VSLVPHFSLLSTLLRISTFTPALFHCHHTFLAIFHPAHVKHLGFTLNHFIHHQIIHTSIELCLALCTNLSLFLITTIHALVANDCCAKGQQAHTIEPVSRFNPMFISNFQQFWPSCGIPMVVGLVTIKL
jgi:hypothetical protein